MIMGISSRKNRRARRPVLLLDGRGDQHSSAILFDGARLHVIDVANGKDIVRLFPWLIHASVVVYGDLPC